MRTNDRMVNNKTTNGVAKSKLSLSAVAMAFALVGVSGCQQTDANEAGSFTPSASSSQYTLYTNGNIYTVNPKQPWAEALVIKDGIIEYVGDTDSAHSYVANIDKVNIKKVINLKGKMVMLGFHDVHIHPLESGSDNTHFTLDTEETNAEKYISVIKNAARRNPNSEWLIGYGHDINTLLEAKRNPLAILDDAVSDRPVIIMEQTSHSMWVNSKALELAGMNVNTPNPVGGVIMKDEDNQLMGILIDNAGNIAMELAMTPTPAKNEKDYYGLTDFVLPELAKHGITSIADARTYWKRGEHKTWQRLAQEDKLTARVVLGLWAYPEETDVDQLATLKSLYQNDPESLLRINQIKLYSDGILINTTASMHDPYEFDMLGVPEESHGNRGINYFTQNRLSRYIAELDAVGFDFHIHAIGERGIHEALNAVEESAGGQSRHRLTHVEVVDPADYKRFAELNVTADCQVAGDFTDPSHWGEVAEYIGKEKAHDLVPIKSLQQAGARVTLSSDWSVSPYNPFIGLQNAVTRAPQELTLEQAIASYTINGAYVMRQENRVGTLEEGKEADLVVLDQNLFEIDPYEISQTQILQTLLAGEEVYRAKGFR
ncbi:amidohydrolase [Litoribacillus peritrichatus]|uniref:Amidohydrolase n=1 Tax=Litoribacillus peritrichatus TaxID=718191 RepID=A0ABP7M9Y8_9GAMM